MPFPINRRHLPVSHFSLQSPRDQSFAAEITFPAGGFCAQRKPSGNTCDFACGFIRSHFSLVYVWGKEAQVCGGVQITQINPITAQEPTHGHVEASCPSLPSLLSASAQHLLPHRQASKSLGAGTTADSPGSCWGSPR